MNAKKIHVHAAHCDSIWSAFLLEMSPDGDGARVQRSVQKTHGESLSPARWQAIKYTRRGDPYVTYRGRRLHLDLFMRTA